MPTSPAIDCTRIDITDILADSPSLGRFLADEAFLAGAWKRAAIGASGEMDEDWRDLPRENPWQIASVLSEDFLPEVFPPPGEDRQP